MHKTKFKELFPNSKSAKEVVDDCQNSADRFGDRDVISVNIAYKLASIIDELMKENNDNN